MLNIDEAINVPPFYTKGADNWRPPIKFKWRKSWWIAIAIDSKNKFYNMKMADNNMHGWIYYWHIIMYIKEDVYTG